MCDFVQNLKGASKASLLCNSMESNNFVPCKKFDTSITKIHCRSDTNDYNTSKRASSEVIQKLLRKLESQVQLTSLENNDNAEGIMDFIAVSKKTAISLCI